MRTLEIDLSANKQKLDDIKTAQTELKNKFDAQDRTLSKIDKTVTRLSLLGPALAAAAFIIGILVGGRI